MIKRIITRFLLILFLLFYMHAYGHDITIAILNFENNSIFNAPDYHTLSKGLAAIMITELSQIESVEIVERRKLQSLVDELKLSQTGFIDEKNGVQVGKMLGAQNLIFGSFIVALDNKIRIDVRIVHVESGVTVKAEQISGSTKHVISLIRKLSQKMMKDLNVRISKQEKKLLNKTGKIDLQAILLYSQALELEDQGDLELASENYQKAIQLEPNFTMAQQRFEQLHQTNEE